MIPGVATALAQMGQCVTERQAAAWAVIALHRGATDDEIDDAWAEWRRLQAQQVQTIGRCKCSHHSSRHGADGECWSAACGCREMRPAS